MREPLSKSNIAIFSEKIMEWGNLVFVGLAIGQLVPGTEPFKVTLFILGLVLFLGAYTFGYLLMRKGDKL